MPHPLTHLYWGRVRLYNDRAMCGVVGALYPGYQSYKAIKNTDVGEYVRIVRVPRSPVHVLASPYARQW